MRAGGRLKFITDTRELIAVSMTMLSLSERFSNDYRKTNTKVTTPTSRNSAMNQSEFLEITRNLFKARGKSRVQGAIGFASH